MPRSFVARALGTIHVLLCAPLAIAGASAGATVLAAHVVAAQPTRREADEPSLPRDVAREVADLYNAPGTTRANGPFDVPADRTIGGDVAVLGGPVTVAGHVTGRLLAINGDVTFQRGARVDGDVIVVGGVVDGRGQAQLGGELRIHRQVLYYHLDDGRLVPETPEQGSDSHWWRWQRRDRRGFASLTLTSGGTYNRVEGLPIHVGPSLATRPGRVRAEVEGLLVYRTSGGFRWDSASVGHVARGEVQVGERAGVRVGARSYDEIAPVEAWQMSKGEVGLATFFAHRDYRDHYNRHGGSVFAELFAGESLTLTTSFADERWASQHERDPFTLFRNGQGWRPNPQLDDGRMHVLETTLHFDTRNDQLTPWAGWYLDASYERGSGGISTFGALSADISPLISPVALPGARNVAPGRRTYGRGFLDLRRYNRLSPEAQLNLRLVLGGWLHGDALPLERRFSVTGPGAMPGFDFRRPTQVTEDLGQCSVRGLLPPGAPAQCERMALAQAEFRAPLHIGVPFDDSYLERVAVHTQASWVVFADAGRGWLVGDRDGEIAYPSGEVPPLSTFLSDIGAGIDFGSGGKADVASFGVYVAKSLSRPDQPANVIVRVRRRF